MRRFSIGTSLGDTFGLMRTRPLAVFVWGLLMVAPFTAGAALILPTLGQIIADMPGPGMEPSSRDDPFAGLMVARMMQFQLASMLMNLGQYVAMAVVYTAIMRAIVRPGETSFFSLRLGMDELRVAVVGLAIGVVTYIALIVVILIGLAIGAAMWGSDPAVVVPLLIVAVLLVVIAFMWAMARVSLMAPASVLYRDFAFSQGWKLASGKGWSLFGMMLLICLIVIVIEAVLIGIGVAAFMSVSAVDLMQGAWPASDNPVPDIEAWAAANWYWFVLGGVLLSLFYGVLLTLGVAPFASACRQLADSDARPPADDAGSPAPTA